MGGRGVLQPAETALEVEAGAKGGDGDDGGSVEELQPSRGLMWGRSGMERLCGRRRRGGGRGRGVRVGDCWQAASVVVGMLDWRCAVTAGVGLLLQGSPQPELLAPGVHSSLLLVTQCRRASADSADCR